jgi:hypothetical protein
MSKNNNDSILPAAPKSLNWRNAILGVFLSVGIANGSPYIAKMMPVPTNFAPLTNSVATAISSAATLYWQIEIILLTLLLLTESKIKENSQKLRDDFFNAISEEEKIKALLALEEHHSPGDSRILGTPFAIFAMFGLLSSLGAPLVLANSSILGRAIVQAWLAWQFFNQANKTQEYDDAIKLMLSTEHNIEAAQFPELKVQFGLKKAE